ncbi:MAG: hypothetical protein R3F51_28495, partial [Cyanobacteriota/Melainabacteria group bacterium]
MQSKPSNGGLNEKRSKIPLSKRLKPILGVILLSNTLLVSGVQSALSKTANQKYDNCTLATELIDKSHSSKDYRQYLLTAIDLIGQKSPTLLGLAYFTLS